jgi:hypothetical protein
VLSFNKDSVLVDQRTVQLTAALVLPVRTGRSSSSNRTATCVYVGESRAPPTCTSTT